MSANFDYYELQIKLIREMLGTCSEASVWDEHVIQKAKKQIKAANVLGKKIAKSLEKYQGVEISENKELAELQSILRAFKEKLGDTSEMPTTPEELAEEIKRVEEDFAEAIKKGDARKATVFMRDKNGHPMISTHMLLGNIKEILKVIVNSGNKDFIKSKVAVGEALALDVKSIEEFVKPNQDIIRKLVPRTVLKPKMLEGKPVLKEDGTPEMVSTNEEVWMPDLCERIIRFERMGKVETAIALSEQLPVGTEFSFTLRVRKGSALNEDVLRMIFDMGKNDGLGAFRGSGNKGAYVFKLKKMEDYVEKVMFSEDGWS